MKYFKNTELAKLYNVSEKSVRNWIDAAEAGKLDLQLHSENGKPYIANVSKNTIAIEQLVAKGKKYKNSRGFKVVRPTEQFYQLYSPKQVVDIIAAIDIYREIPVQYTYFNGGAERWNAYTQNLLKQGAPNSLTNTIELLEINNDYIESLLEKYTHINIIDLGPGNALPIRNLLQRLMDKNMLRRYIAIDISKELLDIAQKNIQDWFNGKVAFEGHIRDVVYDRFDDLLVDDLFADDAATTVNLVLFLGGTLNNFREPIHALTTIRDSMGKKDLLLMSKKLDTQKSRRYFEQTVTGNQDMEQVLHFLNIDKSFYTLEAYFDEKKMARELRARLNVTLNIDFEVNRQKRIIELNKGESILLWRAWHHTALQAIAQFDKTGFEILHTARSKDLDYLQIISKLRTNNQ